MRCAASPGSSTPFPCIRAAALLKLPDGAYQAANVIGLDDTSLFGRPLCSRPATSQDIFAENAFIAVKDSEFYKLENPRIGSEFELNDHRGVIVGIARVASSGLFGVPTLYTTYNRALQYIPNTRFTISYLLVEPKSLADVAEIKQQVAAAGLPRAHEGRVRHEDLATSTNTRPASARTCCIMTVISFIIGLSISGQTFYTFVIENWRNSARSRRSAPRAAN